MNKRWPLIVIGVMSICLLPGLLFAGTTGKIAGMVVDRETNEPLPGANVMIMETTLGAAADADGNFVILNVQVGTYVVKASFIGYRDVTISNVKVSIDLTTELNFNLPSEAIEAQTIEIVAERPLVNKNATNSIYVMTSEDFENMPVRSYAEIVASRPGVVAVGNDMYVRGGRSEEVAFYIDGVYVNDLRTGERVGDVPINSVEEISYQAGGFTAEYGFANSGVVNTSSKTGGTDYVLAGEVVTDGFLSEEEENLGTYSYGYDVYNVALSGPLPLLGDKIRFFVAGEKRFQRDRRPTLGEHPVLVGDQTRVAQVKGVTGPLPNHSLGSWMWNGNIMIDLKPLSLKIGGNSTREDFYHYLQTWALYEDTRNHAGRTKRFADSYYAKITHMLSPNTFYTGTVSYHAHGNEYGDQVLWRDLENYGDYSDWNNDGIYNTIALIQDGVLRGSPFRLGSGLFDSVAVRDEYELNRASVLGAKFDVTHQQGRTHEFKAGFEYRYNTLRRYNVGRPLDIAGTFGPNPNIDPRLAYRAAYTDNYGYPVYFKDGIVDPDATVDSGKDGAKHPIIAAVYLQDKIEVSDLVVNLGVRWDYIDANDKKVPDPHNPPLKEGFMDYNALENTKGSSTISPRLGLSFPVTDRTVFHAQFGKFTQQPQLQFLYTGWDYYAGQIYQGNQVEIGNPSLKPVKTTAYEVGFRQQLGEVAALDITAFYKEIRDLVVLKNRVGALPATYAQYQNGDYGTIKGLSLTFNLRRTERVAANVSYSLQWAGGTGSTAGTNFYVTWISTDEYYPTFVAPLDFDQRHTGSVNVDVRTNPEDGPTLLGGHPFGNMGLNMYLTFGSGTAYTPKRIADTEYQARFSTAFPVAAINSAYANWTYQLDLRLDKTINVGNLNFDVYLWAINVLGTKNPISRKNDRYNYGLDVGATDIRGFYEATGRADDNGWLDTSEGKAWAEAAGGPDADNMYQIKINHPYNWGTPRQLRLGLRFNFKPGF